MARNTTILTGPRGRFGRALLAGVLAASAWGSGALGASEPGVSPGAQAWGGREAARPARALQPLRRPQQGAVLIAAPKLSDPNFAHTAVFILEYDAQGALGLILNRPTRHSLPSVLPDLEMPAGEDDKVFAGGPVGTDRMLVLIRSAVALDGARPVLAQVHVSTSMETLRRVAAADDPDTRFRTYIGYAGWGPGQLDGEILRGDWYLAEADADLVFDSEPASVWHELVERYGGTWVRNGSRPLALALARRPRTRAPAGAGEGRLR